jgi:NAD(P)-dependent dehydrogenase (short-subunit alcohol dehydrogenase family)
VPAVLITGASSGIGRDAALYFNERGYRVFAGVRRAEDGQRVKDGAADPAQLQPLILDVCKDDDIAAARAAVIDQVGEGGLTTVVSNAGIAAMSGPSSCEQCPLPTQQHVMDVNFFGAVRVVQAFLPLLRASRGTVVFNTALMAHTVLPFNAGYAASKCALEGWADSLRREVYPAGIRVAIIEAGYLASELESKQQGPQTYEADQLYPDEAALHGMMSRSSAKLANRRSASPRRMSEAMFDAAQANHPKPRRIVGTGARAIWTIGCLPTTAQDRLINAALKRLGR